MMSEIKSIPKEVIDILFGQMKLLEEKAKQTKASTDLESTHEGIAHAMAELSEAIRRMIEN